MNEHSGWNSKLTFLFAMIGATIGIGNIWRFSYVFYTNGGGSFFIPYIIAILVMGIPFLILEYGLGFRFKESFSKLLHDINPKFEIIAWMLVLFVFIVAIYYMVILSWDFIYFLNSFTFGWGNDPSAFFATSVGGSSDFGSIGSIILPTFIGIIILWVLFWLVSNNDVDKGIGNISKVLMPLLFIIMSFILFYSFTLPGFEVGLKTLLTPNWNALLDVNIWLAGIFSILGYMSVTSSIPITELISEGTSLIFVVLPEIFDVMGPVGRIIAPLLFLSILFAGFTSSLALFEPLLASVCDKFNWSRRKGVTVLTVIACCGSLLFSTGISSHLVEIVDTFVNEFGILILIALQAIIFTRYLDIAELVSVLNKNSAIKVGKKWKFILKYILPAMLIVMWIIGVGQLVYEVDLFKLGIYILITFLVLGLSIFFTMSNSISNDSEE